MYKCEIGERQRQQTIAIRTITPAKDIQQVLGEGYTRVMKYLAQHDIHPAGPPYVCYFNDDMQDLDIEYGFPVSSVVQAHEDIRPSEIPGGRVVGCVHTGPYDEIEGAYTAISEWVSQKKLDMVGTAYEYYLNDPADTPAQELQTLVEFPLK